MKKLLFITLAVLLMAPLAYGQGLTRSDQTIYGNKTFQNDVTVEGTITARGATAGFNFVGDVFYVGDTYGHNSPGNYGKSWRKPFASIDFAIGQTQADHGDIIYVLPWHEETVTSSITVDVAGVSIIGIVSGRNMPSLTPNGAIDCITVTADDVLIANLFFGLPGTDDQTADINVTSDRVTIRGTRHLGSAASGSVNKVSIITIAATAFDILIDDVRMHNKTYTITGAAIMIEGVSERVEIRHSAILDSVGWTLGALADGAAALQMYVHHNVFQCAQANDVCVEFDDNSTGVFGWNFVAGRDTTIADNIIEGTAMDFIENYIVEQAALSGLLHPGVDS